MEKSIIVLAVPHYLQGKDFPGYVKDDPVYRQVIEDQICSEKVDFVFEEAAGRGPSIAKELASTHLGPGHYLDVDPSRNERHKYGIPEDTHVPREVQCWNGPLVFYAEEDYRAHGMRERLWLQRIVGQSFENKGLMICGTFHGLSFICRLTSTGFDVKLLRYPSSASLTTGSGSVTVWATVLRTLPVDADLVSRQALASCSGREIADHISGTSFAIAAHWSRVQLRLPGRWVREVTGIVDACAPILCISCQALNRKRPNASNPIPLGLDPQTSNLSHLGSA